MEKQKKKNTTTTKQTKKKSSKNKKQNLWQTRNILEEAEAVQIVILFL